MISRLFGTSMLVAFLLSATGSYAQDLDVARAAAAATSSLAADQTLPSLVEGVAIEAGTANSQATINFSKNTGKSNFGLKITTPVVDKGSSETQFASLDGLASDVSLDLSFSRLYFPDLSASQKRRRLNAERAVCTNVGLKAPSGDDLGDPCDQQAIEKAVAKRCGYDPVSALLQAAGRECYEESRRAALRELDFAAFPQGIWLFSFGGELGRDNAEYFRADGMEEDETRVPWAFYAATGQVLRSSRWSIKARYQAKYEDEDKATLCAPLEEDLQNAGFEKCKELPVGEPEREESLQLSAEWRVFLTTVAVSPILTYDFEGEIWGAQLPIYFLRDDKDKFNGGLRFGYRDDEGNLEISIFLSKALKLIG